jgi:hypothetical protein
MNFYQAWAKYFQANSEANQRTDVYTNQTTHIFAFQYRELAYTRIKL